MHKDKKIYKTKSDKHSDYFDHKGSFTNTAKTVRNISILPHPITLESYEELSPGITEKLGSMIVAEQEHRHKIAMLKLRSLTSIYCFGQFLSLILAALVIYGTFVMFETYKNTVLASVICISGFAFLAIINVFSTKTFRRDKENFKQKTFKRRKEAKS